MKIILYNGKIYVEKDNFQKSILIEDGIIKEVGTNEEILKNEADRIINLDGKTVLPGFNDSHLHLLGIGSAMSSCNLTSARSIDNVIELGREFSKVNPGLIAMQGRGWNQDYFITGEHRMITRHDLDKISTVIPIVFTRVCGHVATGNTKAN
ncbi:MAG: amidohydrolase family protein [Tissierellia bacterium]|nr:amidohydrolase family protein [Tissierellia bacterium]